MAAHEMALGNTYPRSREEVGAGARVVTVPWHRLTLGAILLLATLLNSWQLGRLGYGNSYYAAAVRSMMQSWHNFFFASFDPGGFVTIDKPPLAFWFQVLSAKLFGYNGVSLLLPSVLAGVLSVWLLYYLVGRRFGPVAGLLAALAMALTPVAVATNRSNIVDSILVLFLLLAAWALSLAAERSSLRWLLLSAVFVGLGFNIKMLEAYLVVPALGFVYLLGASRPWRVRIAHLALATLVLLTVSLSWAVAVDLTPASQRPWVDSTTTNSELDLAIGYNGLQRLTGRIGFGGGGSGGRPAGNSAFTHQPVNGAGAATTQTQQGAGAPLAQTTTGGTTGTAQGSTSTTQRSGRANGNAFRAGGGPPGGGGMFNNGTAGPFRLIGQDLGGQAGWLLPLAVIGLAAAATRRWVRLPLSWQEQGVLLWGAWLLTTGGFFSVAGFFHSYYLVTMAPAVAALAGIGAVVLWQDYRRRGWRGWLLPLALVTTAAVQVSLLRPYPDWSRWLTPLVLSLTVLGAIVLVVARVRPYRTLRLWTPIAAAVGMLALLLAPGAWAVDTAANGGGGMTPSAGPSGFSMPGFGQGRSMPNFMSRFGQRLGSSNVEGGFGLGQGMSNAAPSQSRGGGIPNGFGDDGTTNNGLLSYLEKHQGTTKYLVAVQNSNSAASWIIQTGKPVMSLGGFGGNDPILTLQQLQALVKNNTVRYFSGVGGGGGGGGNGNNSIGQWVQSACAVVPATAYGGATTTSFGNANMGAGGSSSGGLLGIGKFATVGIQGSPPSAPSSSGPSAGGFGGPGGGFGGPGGGFAGPGRGGQQLYDCAGAVK